MLKNALTCRFNCGFQIVLTGQSDPSVQKYKRESTIVLDKEVLMNHEKFQCPGRLVPCINGCGRRIRSDSMFSHTSSYSGDCPERIVRCPSNLVGWKIRIDLSSCCHLLLIKLLDLPKLEPTSTNNPSIGRLSSESVLSRNVIEDTSSIMPPIDINIFIKQNPHAGIGVILKYSGCYPKRINADAEDVLILRESKLTALSSFDRKNVIQVEDSITDNDYKNDFILIRFKTIHVWLNVWENRFTLISKDLVSDSVVDKSRVNKKGNQNHQYEDLNNNTTITLMKHENNRMVIEKSLGVLHDQPNKNQDGGIENRSKLRDNLFECGSIVKADLANHLVLNCCNRSVLIGQDPLLSNIQELGLVNNNKNTNNYYIKNNNNENNIHRNNNYTDESNIHKRGGFLINNNVHDMNESGEEENQFVVIPPEGFERRVGLGLKHGIHHRHKSSLDSDSTTIINSIVSTTGVGSVGAGGDDDGGDDSVDGDVMNVPTLSTILSNHDQFNEYSAPLYVRAYGHHPHSVGKRTNRNNSILSLAIGISSLDIAGKLMNGDNNGNGDNDEDSQPSLTTYNDTLSNTSISSFHSQDFVEKVQNYQQTLMATKKKALGFRGQKTEFKNSLNLANKRADFNFFANYENDDSLLYCGDCNKVEKGGGKGIKKGIKGGTNSNMLLGIRRIIDDTQDRKRCEFGCGAYLPSFDLFVHMRDECTRRSVTCHQCELGGDGSLWADELINHMEYDCHQRDVGCPLMCEGPEMCKIITYQNVRENVISISRNNSRGASSGGRVTSHASSLMQGGDKRDNQNLPGVDSGAGVGTLTLPPPQGRKMKASEVSQHVKFECYRRLVSCGNKCGEMIEAQHKLFHENGDCINRLVFLYFLFM